KVNDKTMNQYLKWWGQGISPPIVQQMIQEDLTEQLNENGYQKASVETRVEAANGKSVYYFDVTTGPQYKTMEIKFKGVEVYKPSDLQNSLQLLYQTPAQMFTEAIHDASSVADNIKVLYLQRGYISAKISIGTIMYDDQSSAVSRVFVIQEGAPLRVDQVT